MRCLHDAQHCDVRKASKANANEGWTENDNGDKSCAIKAGGARQDVKTAAELGAPAEEGGAEEARAGALRQAQPDR